MEKAGGKKTDRIKMVVILAGRLSAAPVLVLFHRIYDRQYDIGMIELVPGIRRRGHLHISSIYMKTGSCRILTRRVFISSTIRRCTIICAHCG